MVQDKGPADVKRRMSAFAVAQSGTQKLDKAVVDQLHSDVMKLHSDEKLNRRVKQIANNYQRNLLTAKKKKLKKRKEKLFSADAVTASQSKKVANKRKTKPDTDISEVPLNWYDAPKSDKKRKIAKIKSEQSPASNTVQQYTNSTTRYTASAATETAATETAATETAATETAATETATGQVLGKNIVQRSKKQKQTKKKRDDKLGLVSSTDQKSEQNNCWNVSNAKAGKVANAKVEKPAKVKKAANAKAEKAANAKVSSSASKKIHVEEWVDPAEAAMDWTGGLTGVTSPAESEESLEEHEDPDEVARELFAKLLHPHDVKTFFKKTWLKKPLHIRRKDSSYYEEEDWFSTEELDRILVQDQVRFGVNIDVTSYRDGKRETHNPPGRAYPAIVWDYYQQGCSVRLLNPQTYSEGAWRLLSSLQEMFGCMVGANVYLTPPGTQGFAPHYDDIEAFVLQLEGRKHWKVYGPRTDADVWPLASSPNLTEKSLGKPVIDCVLEPGDLLYFPRGAIHQAMAQDDQHSLHITVSTHQKNTWSDLLNVMLPAALANATENDAEFRESLPNDYLNYTGIAFQEKDGIPRQSFLSKVQKLMEKMMSFAPVDGACDLMAKKFVHDSLPPFLNPVERCHTIADQGEKWVNGEVRDAVELEPDTRVRLLRKHGVRIVNEQSEDDKLLQNPSAADSDDESGNNIIRVYYSTDNERLYHGNGLQYFDVDGDLAPAIEFLQISYPQFVSIDELPLEDITLKIGVATQLYEKGLLLTEQRLETTDSECSEDDSQSEET